MHKQVIVIRSDLKMSGGKAAAQAAHASVSALEKANKQAVAAWKKEGQKKVVLKASLEELMDIRDKCAKAKIPSALVADAGLTEVPSGTVTALGIGPDKEEKIDRITGSLPLLK